MRFSRWVFWLAGAYGLLTLVPNYFAEPLLEPPTTHPEYFYGFIGVAVAWQLAFLVIGCNPIRYRLLMLPAVVEKVTFGIAAPVLVLLGRTPAIVAVFGTIDLVLAVLFTVSFFVCAKVNNQSATST